MLLFDAALLCIMPNWQCARTSMLSVYANLVSFLCCLHNLALNGDMDGDMSDCYQDFVDLKKGEYVMRLRLHHDDAALLDNMKDTLGSMRGSCKRHELYQCIQTIAYKLLYVLTCMCIWQLDCSYCQRSWHDWQGAASPGLLSPSIMRVVAQLVICF